MTSHRLPTFYLTHGGGPWPWMEGRSAEAHAGLAQALRRHHQNDFFGSGTVSSFMLGQTQDKHD